MQNNRPVSVVMTVFNEADNIEKVLHTLLEQSRPPDEIVVVDGGSGDGTYEKLQHFAAQDQRVHSMQLPGANISRGRNAAIEASRHELIAVTDAGVRLRPDWLEQLVAPFASSDVQVVSGFFRSDPDPSSPFQIAMGATVLPSVEEIEPDKFLPSSRSVAFTKSAWRAAGGYPEWLDYCEDLIFDINLKNHVKTFAWKPQALALFAPRRSLGAFWTQYYRYARGDGKADLFLKRHLLRYFIYGVFAPAGIIVALKKPIAWLLLFVCGLGYLWSAYKRLFKYLDEFKKLPLPGKIAAVLWVPLIRATGDIAKMAGYPLGRLWRYKFAPGAPPLQGPVLNQAESVASQPHSQAQ
ncbi:MAG TPA: glycosyltransferase [Chloroflexia bacterium]|nr:glycosyltransferase [Chloroflexia bacterium]